jgi:hypothetical protein
VPHDENLPGEKALPFTLRFTDLVPEVPGILCMRHPAMCRVLAAEAEAAGAVFLRGVTDVAVTAGAQASSVSSTLRPAVVHANHRRTPYDRAFERLGSVSDVRSWPIASFRCASEFGRYRGIADSATPPTRQIYGLTA